MQTQSVGGNDNFWQTLDSNVVTTTLLNAVVPIEKSLSKGHYCLVKILESLCLQGHFFLPTTFEYSKSNMLFDNGLSIVLSTCCSVQSSDLDNRLGQIQ